MSCVFDKKEGKAMDYDKLVLKCNLKRILEERKISVNKLSNEIEERRSTINDLVNNVDMNNRRIPATLLTKLKVYLEVSFDDLFEVKRVEDKENT